MRILIILIFCSVFGYNQSFSQNANPLDIKFVDAIIFKFEAGIAITYDSIPLSSGKYIFVVSHFKNAYIQKQAEGREYVHFDHVKTTKINNVVIDDFIQVRPKGQYKIRLSLTKGKETTSSRDWRGTMTLKYGTKEKVIKVHGFEKM